MGAALPNSPLTDGKKHMPISIPGRIVVFDYGEVISIVPAAEDRAEILAIAGSPNAELFWDIYWRHRPALDQGILSARQYWDLIAHDLGTAWDTATAHRLWLADFRSWLAVDRPTLDVLIDLQHGGTRMALLSNAGLDFASYYRHGMLGDFFEAVFVSGELGTLKPGPDIYQALINGLDVTPERIIFIDNREDNILGAEGLGIVGHVYTNAAELRNYLESLASPSTDSEQSSLTV
jgi:putative hydrolase of the HAD superfamily